MITCHLSTLSDVKGIIKSHNVTHRNAILVYTRFCIFTFAQVPKATIHAVQISCHQYSNMCHHREKGCMPEKWINFFFAKS